MSHVAKVKTIVKDLDSLRQACKVLGLEFRENQQTFKWYGRWANDYDDADAAHRHGIAPEDYGKCLHAIGVPGNAEAYEVGVAKNPQGDGYVLLFDFWRGGYGLIDAIGQDASKLTQRYSAEVARKHLRQAHKGCRIHETVTADGRIRVTGVLAGR